VFSKPPWDRHFELGQEIGNDIIGEIGLEDCRDVVVLMGICRGGVWMLQKFLTANLY
jgi:hypothetical protein